ncbi:hypothetical protein [Intrasporangium sp. YIM S08009]|uniref:hypothetical protein n=1 Tax=Intrasporangium zincisolvens TaxID=3080018 RepID=UPI002B05E57D|nr:hypothetical protein [Intrasporangium sp. YIM S08009]
MTDRTTTALAEALREHHSDLDGGASPTLVIERARRRRARRRAGAAAGVLGAAATAVAVVALAAHGPRLAAPRPAASSPITSRPEATPTTTAVPTAADARRQAYAWASALPLGGPFQPVGAPVVTSGADGRLTYRDKAGSVTLGNEPMTLEHSMRLGLGEDWPATTFVVGRGAGSSSVWAVGESGPRTGSKVWSGARVLDVLGGARGFAFIAGDAQGAPTRLVTIDVASLAVRSVALPPNGPQRPRLATWAQDSVTIVDGQDLLDPTSATESHSFSWSPTSGWRPGQRARWFGAAAPGFDGAGAGRNVVLVGSGDEVCAHLMVGTTLDPDALTCAPHLDAQHAPDGSLVLVSRFLGGSAGVVATVFDVADGSAKELPVGELPSPLRWESNLTLAGQVHDATGQKSVPFRVDLGKGQRHERLPAPLPQG